MLMLANAGVPMLFLHLPAMLLALLPIIAVETYIATRRLKRRTGNTVGPIAVANCASMLLGFPLLWIGAVIIQMLVGGGRAYGLDTWSKKVYAVTVQAPWLIPYENELRWMIPVAAIVMLVPAFFLSVWSERLVLQRFWPGEAKKDLRYFSWLAHGASYCVLVALWGAYAFYSIVTA